MGPASLLGVDCELSGGEGSWGEAKEERLSHRAKGRLIAPLHVPRDI